MLKIQLLQYLDPYPSQKRSQSFPEATPKLLHPEARAEEGCERGISCAARPWLQEGRGTCICGGWGASGLESWSCTHLHSVNVHVCCHSKSETHYFDRIHIYPAPSSRRNGNMPGFPANAQKILFSRYQPVDSISAFFHLLHTSKNDGL